MNSTIDKLRAEGSLSDESLMKFISSKVLMEMTDYILEKLQTECKDHQDLPDDMSWLIGKYLKEIDDYIKRWNIDETVWRGYLRSTFQSMKDNCALYSLVHDVSRTVSASLMLRYSNVAYTLSYELKYATLQNIDGIKEEIIEDFIHAKEDLKSIVKSLKGLEDEEMRELNRLDSHLAALLKNNGDLYY